MERGISESKTMCEVFREAFTQYLAIGMTYEDFWERESWLVKNYREAQKQKRDENNYFAWLHGVYVLNALQSGVPVMLTGMAKEKVTLPEFPTKPIDFTADQKAEQEKKQMELQMARMQAMVEQFNATFMRKHGDIKQ